MSKGIVVSAINVQFGGVVALNNLSIKVLPGQILGVIGPNGSGKSTLFNAISGLVQLSTGSIRINDMDVQGASARALIQGGLTRTFQTPRVDPELTTEEAILCGFLTKSEQSLVDALLRLPRCRREEDEFKASAQRIMQQLGLLDVAGIPLGELPMGQVRLVDIGRAMAAHPRYLLLDEPAAGLSLIEQRRMGDVVRSLAASNVGILLVEHNFDLIGDLCDHVVVLDRGKLLIEGDIATLRDDPEFVRCYLGSRAA